MKSTLIDIINSLPLSIEEKRRIQITTMCVDTNGIPGVDGAGKIFDSPRGRYQLMHNGIKIMADGYCGRWMTELIKLLEGCHEPQEEMAFSEIIKYIPDNATMLELGSWWSYYSLWFQKEILNARNYMIEPDPDNIEVGRQNFELNGMNGVFLNVAIGKASKDSISFQCASDNRTIQIPVISIDDFVIQEQIKNIELLLCDIQGFELEMLEGSIQSINKGMIRFVVISTHHHYISQDPLIHQKCLIFLKEHSAHILVEHRVAESFSGDGLIVASFKSEDVNLPKIEISHNSTANNLFRETEYDLSDALEKNKQLQAELDSIYRSRSYRIIKSLQIVASRARRFIKGS